MLNYFEKGIGARCARTEQEGWDGLWDASAELISIARGSDCAAWWDHGTGGVTHHALQLIVPRIPVSVTVATRNTVGLVGKVRPCATIARFRPTTTRHGAVSGRVRFRWVDRDLRRSLQCLTPLTPARESP